MGLSGIFKQQRIEGLRPSILFAFFIYTGEQGRRSQVAGRCIYKKRNKAAGRREIIVCIPCRIV